MSGQVLFFVLLFVILNNNIWYFFKVTQKRNHKGTGLDILNAGSMFIIALIFGIFILIEILIWFFTHW